MNFHFTLRICEISIHQSSSAVSEERWLSCAAQAAQVQRSISVIYGCLWSKYIRVLSFGRNSGDRSSGVPGRITGRPFEMAIIAFSRNYSLGECTQKARSGCACRMSLSQTRRLYLPISAFSTMPVQWQKRICHSLSETGRSRNGRARNGTMGNIDFSPMVIAGNELRKFCLVHHRGK
jgi:hypothetical protein